MQPDRSPAVRRVIEAAARVAADPSDAALAELLHAVDDFPIGEMPRAYLDAPSTSDYAVGTAGYEVMRTRFGSDQSS